jgi:hypothetical protein
VILPRSTFLEQNLDPTLHQNDNATRAQHHLTLLESEEDSEDSEDNNNKDADEKDGRKDDKEEGENDDIVKGSQEFGWGEAG